MGRIREREERERGGRREEEREGEGEERRKIEELLWNCVILRMKTSKQRFCKPSQ